MKGTFSHASPVCEADPKPDRYYTKKIAENRWQARLAVVRT